MTSILSVRELAVRYGERLVLSDISFDVVKGDYIGIVGPNGSGKTSLLKAILGLLPKAQGSIELFGSSISSFKQWTSIGYVPQKISGFNPYFPATVREIVSLGIPLRSGTSVSRETRVDTVLDLLSITSFRGALIGELSGGQQQRVHLARALVNDPELLVLDEPSTALDPSVRNEFFTLLKKLNTEQGMTILLVTHDIGTIGEHAAKLLYIDKRVVFFGGFNDFCGSPEMTEYFGGFAQHLICHQHHGEKKG